LRAALFYSGIVLALLGFTLLAMSYRNTSAVNTGSMGSHTFNEDVGPYGFKSLNFTAGTNNSIVLTVDAEFPAGVSLDAYDKGEGCIDVLVVDKVNYDKWLRNESATTFLSAYGTHTSTYMFPIGSGGIYYLILSNAGRCTEKLVTIELKETSTQIVNRQQFQVAGLGSLSFGILLVFYGFTSEKIPTVKTEEKASEQEDNSSQDDGNSA